MPKARENSSEKKRQYLGRVANRCKVKKVQLIELGEFHPRPGWFNAGYIFPKGFSAKIDYRKITDPATQDIYHCQINEKNNKPLFVVQAQSCGRSFEGKSPTACWKQVLDCINLTLVSNGAQPSKTQVAGPEYFGLNDPEIVAQIEQLDVNKVCDKYWNEKERILVAREEYLKNHPKTPRKEKDSPEHENDENVEENYNGAWSTIERGARYEKRTGSPVVDTENPLPEYTDPITGTTIVNPYISPYGHVLGYSTWVQCLKETENMCPFTKQSLIIENISKLTKKNIDYFENIILN